MKASDLITFNRNFKNRIINGDFSVWQRGENFLYGTPATWAASTSYNVGDIVIPTTANGYYYVCTVAGTSDSTECTWPTKVGEKVTDNTVTWECKGIQYQSNGYTADRIFSIKSADGLFTITKSNLLNKNSVKLQVDTPPSDLTSTNYWHGFVYRFEGQHLYDLAINKKDITISFWFNSNVTGIYSLCLRNLTNGGVQSYVTTFNYVTTNVPQKIVITIPLNAEWNPALQNDENLGFDIVIGFLNQGDYATSTTEQWINGNYLTTPDCVNWGATAGNYIKIAELQLEEGDIATEFEEIPYDIQLQRCMRYYFNGNMYIVARGYNSYGETNIIFPVKMRVTPAINYSLNSSDSSNGAIYTYTIGIKIIAKFGTTDTARYGLNKNWYVDAEL